MTLITPLIALKCENSIVLTRGRLKRATGLGSESFMTNFEENVLDLKRKQVKQNASNQTKG